MRDLLDEKLTRFEELDRQMSDLTVLANGQLMATLARERGTLAKLAMKYRRFKDLNAQISDAIKMVEGHDADMRELAAAELPELKAEREALWDELVDLTVGGDDANRSTCVMEIRAGTGGEEAGLFARDLFEMYRHFAEQKGWKTEVLDMSATELGGFKEVSLGVDGEGCYRVLQYESGGHRVQRVPETEAKGRIHTSAATVAVMAEPEDVEIDLKSEDYRLDLYCASGPGGQHVNKTASAVRMSHYETGIVVQCQDERSQHKNKAKALRMLKSKLYEHKRLSEHAKRAETRRTLVGSGDRSQRIRTYNFPENRITDHRINFTLYKLDSVLSGALDPLVEKLIEFDRQEQRAQFGNLD